MQKPWYYSSANWGAILVAIGMIFTAGGKALQGEINVNEAIPIFIVAIGIICAITGIRKRLPDTKP